MANQYSNMYASSNEEKISLFRVIFAPLTLSLSGFDKIARNKMGWWVLLFPCMLFMQQVTAQNATKGKRAVAVTVDGTPISCNGIFDAKAWATASGGEEPYEYYWSIGQQTDTIRNLGPGTFSVTIIDNAGETATASITFVDPPLFFGSTFTSDTAFTCDIHNITATADPVGGIEPYSYAWEFPFGIIETEQTINITQPGTYPVTVYDAHGCFFESEVVLGSYNIPIITLTLVDSISCNGRLDGKAFATVTNGVEPYQYLWSNGFTTDTIANVGFGSYTLTVTDADGCESQASIFIPQPLPFENELTSNDITCYGHTTGAVFTNTIGGTEPYNYVWSNGTVQPDVINVPAGTYTVTITDDRGCQIVDSMTVFQGNEIVLSTATVNVSCYGGNNGVATVFASGGNGTFTFNWSNGSTNQQIFNLTAGTYTVYVTDGSNCINTANAVVNSPDAFEVTTHSTPEILSGSDGTATVIVTGGTAPYSYIWSNGGTTQQITGLTTGDYFVTITDSRGCTTTGEVYVDFSNCAFAGNLITVNPSCYGSEDGGIFPEFTTPGVEPYYFQWSNGSNDLILNNVGAGTYSVTIIDNANCMLFLSATLTQPEPIVVDFVVTHPTEQANPYGKVDFTITGGATPYKLNWNGEVITGGTNITLNNIPSGTHTVTITDAKGCTTTASFFINTLGCFLTASISVESEPICNGDKKGKLCVDFQYNYGDVSIQWSNGITTVCNDNLSGGIYSVIVRDTAGCTATHEVQINEPSAIVMDNLDVEHGHDNFDGHIKLHVLGGNPPFNYQWTKNGEPFATTRDILGLNNGIYQLTVVDSKGCTRVFDPIEIKGTIDNHVISLSATQIYPNPTSQYINIDISRHSFAVLSVEWMSASGEKGIFSKVNFDSPMISLDMSKMASGTYMLKIITSSGTYYNKVIKI